MRNVLSAHEEELSLSLPDLGVEEVTELLEGLYSQREEIWVGRELYSLLLCGGEGARERCKTTEESKVEDVKMEPELDLSDLDEDGFQDDMELDVEETEDLVDVKEETVKKPVKKGKRRGRPKKRVSSDDDSSGEEWEKFSEKPKPVKTESSRRSAKFPFRKISQSEEEEEEGRLGSPTKTLVGAQWCLKCGRSLKGHVLPRHSRCQLEGVDEEGLARVREHHEWRRIRKKENDTRYREKHTAEKGYANGYIRLPCDRLDCDVCEIQGFSSEFAVFTHIRKVHGPKEQLECEEEGCEGKTFKNAGALVYHKEKCHQEKAPCAVCGTTEYSTLKNHMVNKHPRPCSPKTCDQCGKVFTSRVSFKHHVKRHQDEKPAGSQKWVITKMLGDFERDCQCNLQLKSNLAKLRHFKLFHLNYEQCEKCEKIVMDLAEGHHKCSKLKKHQPKGPFICKHCGVEFNSHGGMDYHVKAQHIKEMVECPVCLKTLPKLNFASHMAVHKPKTPCNICGKLVSKMKDHMESMHVDDSDMKARCDACGKGFPSDQKLRDHTMNVHLKLRPYKCRYKTKCLSSLEITAIH